MHATDAVSVIETSVNICERQRAVSDVIYIAHLKCGKQNFNFNYILTKEAAELNICFLKRIDRLPEINVFLQISEDKIMEKLLLRQEIKANKIKTVNNFI